jgi:hypothetical protein
VFVTLSRMFIIAGPEAGIVQQGSLFPVVGVTSLGPTPPGATDPQWLRVDTTYASETYAAKQASAQYPDVLVNETICAALGMKLGLPIPRCVRLRYNGALLFGTRRIENEVPAPYSPDLLRSCENAHLIPDMVAFDVLIANWDRSQDNIVIEQKSRIPPKHYCWLIDHSHALDFSTDAELCRSVLDGCLERHEQFGSFVARVKRLTSAEWIEIGDHVPPEWIPPGCDVQAICSTLARRAAQLPDLLGMAFKAVLR